MSGNGVAPSTVVAIVGGAALAGLLGFMFLRTRHGQAPPPPPPPPAVVKATDTPTATTEKEWVRVTPEGSGCSVLFPVQPGPARTGTIVMDGRKVTITSVSHETEHSMFVSGHAQLPPDLDPDTELLAKSLAAGWKLEVTHSMKISYKGMACSDFEGRLAGKNVKLHGRIFVASGILHVFLVGLEDESTEIFDKFFDGVQLEAR